MDCNNFMLFETMLLKHSKIFLLNNHLLRIYESAKYFGFETKHLESLIDLNLKDHSSMRSCYIIKSCDLVNLNPLLLESLWGNASIFSPLKHSYSHGAYIVKLMLCANGIIEFHYQPYTPISTNFIAISHNKVYSKNPYLLHKTTNRTHYIHATPFIMQNVIFDALYFNERDELTEGARSNVVLRFGDDYFTPKRECGVLYGTLLRTLLDSKLCNEAILSYTDVKRADEIFCLNSVRGIIPVQICYNLDKKGNLCKL